MVSVYIAQTLCKKKVKKIVEKIWLQQLFPCKIYFFAMRVMCKANTTLELNLQDTKIVTPQKSRCPCSSISCLSTLLMCSGIVMINTEKKPNRFQHTLQHKKKDYFMCSREFLFDALNSPLNLRLEVCI